MFLHFYKNIRGLKGVLSSFSQLSYRFSASKNAILDYEPLIQIEEKEHISLFLNEIYNLKHNKEFFIQRNQEILNELTVKSKKYAIEKDPIKEIMNKLSNFYQFIKENILTTNLVQLNTVSHHYFSVEGKLFRPILNMLLAKLLFDIDPKNLNKDFYQNNVFLSQKNWAAVIEILHIASLVHDDILDNSTTRRGLITVHEKFGKINATYAGNYLVGRAGRKIGNFNDLQIYEVYSMIMDNLTAGEYIQATKNRNFKNMGKLLIDYMIKSYYKTASLMAHSCRGVCLLNGGAFTTQEKCFRIGQHLGIAFQLIDDILDFTSSSEELGKNNLSDIKEGNLNGPVLFAIQELQFNEKFDLYEEMTGKLAQKQISTEDLLKVNEFIGKSSGIEKTKYLAGLHAKKALEIAEEILSGKNAQSFAGLVTLALKAVTRKK